MDEIMLITDIKVFPINRSVGKLRAFVRVVLGYQLQLTGLRIYEGSGGLFVSYPTDPDYRGEDFRQLFYPVTRELRESIESAVLAKYLEVLK